MDKSEKALQARRRRSDIHDMVAPSGSEDEDAPSRPADHCVATVLVRGHGRFTCEKDADHEGPHEAEMTGRWQRVMWTG